MIYKIVSIIVCLFICSSSFAQLKDINYELSSITSVSTESEIPFWLQSNKNGMIQDSNSELLQLNIIKPFNEKSNFDYSYGIDFIASVAKQDKLYLSQYFMKLKYRKMYLSLGAENPEERFDALSATNGSIIFSGNARAIPMLTAKIDFVTIPLTKGYLSFKGSLSHGWMNNERYVQNIFLHHKNLYVRLGKEDGFSLIAGIEHYAFWGGTSPEWGKLQGGWRDYPKIFFVKSGEPIVSDSGQVSENESIWKLGDHKGQNSFELCYNDKTIKSVIYAKSVYEDSSGRNIFKNRDLNLGFYINIKNSKILNALMYEHFSTTYQSGIRPQPHKELVDIIPYLGPDNNFNHGIYTSGWTNYGRMMGMPLMLARKPNIDGITNGIANSAINAHHFGLKGEIEEYKYRFLYTYSKNYGVTGLGNIDGKYIQTYTYETPLKQQSLFLEIILPDFKLPFKMSAALAYDFGELLANDNFGFQFKITKSNFFKRK